MRIPFAVNAVLAWAGVVLTLVASVFFGRPAAQVQPGLYGSVPGGPWSKVVDVFSYFTVWSVVVVAVSTTLLALQPHVDTRLRRVLRLSGLLMITITAVVYAVLLAPSTRLAGMSRVSNPWVHILVPAVTLVVWIAWGPHGRIDRRVVGGALVVPVVWVVYAMTRGAVDGLYPYGFLDVHAHGVGPVAVTLLGIVMFALVLAALFAAIDVALIRRARPGEVDRTGPTGPALH